MRNVRETVFSDQTVKFPKRSLRENKDIMVLIETNSNIIMVAPTQSRYGKEMK